MPDEPEEVESKITERMFDVDASDPLTHERGRCLQTDCHVRKVFLALKECSERVLRKPYTMETCHQETVDLMEAIDHCVHDKAFVKLS